MKLFLLADFLEEEDSLRMTRKHQNQQRGEIVQGEGEEREWRERMPIGQPLGTWGEGGGLSQLRESSQSRDIFLQGQIFTSRSSAMSNGQP